MEINVIDTGETLDDVSELAQVAATLPKTLPGMTAEPFEGTTEPEICPTCNQKIITTQPGGMDVEQAMDTAGRAADCCGKAFDCFGKGLDTVDKVQAMTEE